MVHRLERRLDTLPYSCDPPEWEPLIMFTITFILILWLSQLHHHPYHRHYPRQVGSLARRLLQRAASWPLPLYEGELSNLFLWCHFAISAWVLVSCRRSLFLENVEDLCFFIFRSVYCSSSLSLSIKSRERQVLYGCSTLNLTRPHHQKSFEGQKASSPAVRVTRGLQVPPHNRPLSPQHQHHHLSA